MIEVVNFSARAVPRAFLARYCRAMRREVGKRAPQKSRPGRRARDSENTLLTLAFLSEPEARALNRRFRGKDYATDVLSFGEDSRDRASTSIGELVFCPDVVHRQARAHGFLFREELGYLVLHGYLHLLGYEHEEAARARRQMFDLQDDVWAAIAPRLCARRRPANRKG